jgi:hypothetical protein
MLCAQWSLAGALLLALLVATGARAQSATEIIRGRVFGPDSVPVAQAEVRVTGLVSRMTQSARTDARGSYTLVFPQAEGEYLVAIRRFGFRTTSFRLSRVGLSPILGSDVYLAAASQVLDRVIVTAGPTIGERSAIGEVDRARWPTRFPGGPIAIDGIAVVDPRHLVARRLDVLRHGRRGDREHHHARRRLDSWRRWRTPA